MTEAGHPCSAETNASMNDAGASGWKYLPDILMRVIPPKLGVLVIEAHQRQHTSGEQTVGVLLHVLPCGRQCQSMREVLQGQVQHPWGKPFTLRATTQI